MQGVRKKPCSRPPQVGEHLPHIGEQFDGPQKIKSLPQLPYRPKPHQFTAYLIDYDNLLTRLKRAPMSDEDKLLILIEKVHPKTYFEIRQNPIFRNRSETYIGFREVLTEKVKEDWVETGFFSQHPTHLAVLGSEENFSVSRKRAHFCSSTHRRREQRDTHSPSQ